MKKQVILLCSFVAVGGIFSGCASADPHIAMTPPAYVEQMPSKETGLGISQPGSLFGRGDNPLFADRKAMNVNDIVTVIIQENTNQTSQANKNTTKDSTIALNGGQFTAGAGPLSNVANTLNKYSNIGFSAGGESGFSGSGTSTRTEAFTTTISARIVKVLSNGNYFIEGSKEILLNNEKQIMQITGVIRPYDISQNNEISSRYVSDAKISYITQGDIAKATNKPWGTKLVDTIWPF